MAEDEYTRLTERLLEMLRPGFGGAARPTFVADVRRLAEEAMRLAGDSYIREKGRSLVHWVEIACSARRHAKWGLESVERFAYEDAYKLRHYAGRSAP